MPNFHSHLTFTALYEYGTYFEDIWYFILEAELFQPWRGFLQRTYTKTALLEMSCEISG